MYSDYFDMCIQLCYLNGDYVFIKGVKPLTDSTGLIILISDGVISTENYSIGNNFIETDNWNIPIQFLISFLIANGSTEEIDGEEQAILSSIGFEE